MQTAALPGGAATKNHPKAQAEEGNPNQLNLNSNTSRSHSSSALLARLPTLPLSAVAAVVASALIVVCSMTMLLVTVPSSMDAAETFGPRFSNAAAAIGAQRSRDVLAVLIEPYRALAHGTASGLLPIFTHLTGTSLVLRHQLILQYVSAMRMLLKAHGDQIKDVTIGFTDRTHMNCISSDGFSNDALWHRCLTTDRYNGSGWGYDWEWVGANLTRFRTYASGYNVINQDWYKKAPKDLESSKRAFFSEVYVVWGYDSAVVDVTSPLFGPPPVNKLLGVTSISLDLQRMSRFLAEIPGMTAGTQVVLLDNGGYLVGASNRGSSSGQGNSKLEIWNRTDYNESTYNETTHVLTPNCSRFKASANTIRRVYCRYNGGDYPGSPALNALWARHYNRLWQNNSNASLPPVLVNASWGARLRLLGGTDESEEGTRHFVSVAPVTLPRADNLNWLLIVLVPELDVVGEILRGRDVALYSGLGVTAAACVLCALALVWLLRPLVDVGRRMGDAATLQDEHLPGKGPRSLLREVRSVQDAMYRLCGQLKKAKTFLPVSMLTMLTATTEGSDGGHHDDDDVDDEGTLLGAFAITPRNDDSGSGQPSLRQSNIRRQSSIVSSLSSVGHRSRTVVTGAAATGSTANRSVSASASSSRVVSQVAAVTFCQRVVSIVSLNVHGFHKDIRAGVGTGLIVGGGGTASHRHNTSAFAALVGAAEQCAAAHRGVLDSFHGDRLFLSFNAVKPTGTSHSVLALRAALQLTGTDTTGAKSEPTPQRDGVGFFAGRLGAGVASGLCTVGTMGSEAQKRFAVVGPAYTQAAILERLGRLYAATASSSEDSSDNHTTGDDAPAATAATTSVTRPPQRAHVPFRVLVAGTAAQDAEALIELAHLDVVNMPGGGTAGLSSDRHKSRRRQEQQQQQQHRRTSTEEDGSDGVEKQCFPMRVSCALSVRAQRLPDAWLLQTEDDKIEHITGIEFGIEAANLIQCSNRAFALGFDGQHRAAAATILFASTRPLDSTPTLDCDRVPSVAVGGDNVDACAGVEDDVMVANMSASTVSNTKQYEKSDNEETRTAHCNPTTTAADASVAAAAVVRAVRAVLQRWERQDQPPPPPVDDDNEVEKDTEKSGLPSVGDDNDKTTGGSHLNHHSGESGAASNTSRARPMMDFYARGVVGLSEAEIEQFRSVGK